MDSLKIYQAEPEHCDTILGLLNPSIQKGLILPRDKNDILKNINNFFVAEFDNDYVGCVSIKDYSSGLFEIRSLAVGKNHEGKGVGTLLVLNTVNYIKHHMKAWRVFALTRRPNVFKGADFKIVNKGMFPEKIWDDCVKCLNINQCDEVAVQRYIN
ncbi:MAG TPA: GNAT family N-acetyltransferase [Victivallales bacterium]|nr:GNAT family N-acetyltransferase [Victivallales bacterium]